jgi:hypothetical protein
VSTFPSKYSSSWKNIGKEMYAHVSGSRILGRKCLHMSQEEEYWEGNVDTCFRKKDIGKEMFTHVSGRRILRRKCLHMSQEEGYWE